MGAVGTYTNEHLNVYNIFQHRQLSVGSIYITIIVQPFSQRLTYEMVTSRGELFITYLCTKNAMFTWTNSMHQIFTIKGTWNMLSKYF